MFTLFYKYCICSIRRCGYYLFHHTILCGFYSRAATIREQRLLNSVSQSVKSFVNVKAMDTEFKESDPFTDVEEDKDELEETKLVLVNC